MTWSRRAIRHDDGRLALHRVDDEGRAAGRRPERPVGLAVDADESVEEIERSLRTALRDLLERPILDVVEIGQARRDPAQPR